MGKTLVFEIENPEINAEEKIGTVLAMLAKATGTNIELEHSHAEESKSEPTPYRCLRELTEKIINPVQSRLWEFYGILLAKWVGSDLEKAEDRFKLNGKIFLNPKTGSYLTKKEWNIIKKDLNRIFEWLYGKSDEAIVKQAMAMGKVLQSMDPDARLSIDNQSFNMKGALSALSEDRQYQHIIDFAEVHTGELIQDVTERSRKAIVKVIMQAYQDRIYSKELEDRLFDEFDILNRDFRRIAETETATNFNNGYLIGELKDNSNKGEHIFMQGISGAGACSFCANEVNNRIVVLLPDAPSTGGDTVVIEGNTYTAIWPGKNNFGRKRPQWWVSAGTQHPHCRCSWVRTSQINMEYMSRLRTAMST